MQEVRILTHESVVHFQLEAIEKLLKRDINFKVTLNQKHVVSNIQFSASPDEILSIQNDLRFKIFREQDGNFFLFQRSREK